MDNKALEESALRKLKKSRYRELCKELTKREIDLSNFLPENENSPKQLGIAALMNQGKMTVGEAIILRQAAEAIYNGDTRAAEFVRDTAGEKPSTDVSIAANHNPLGSMTDEELEEAIDKLKAEDTSEQ